MKSINILSAIQTIKGNSWLNGKFGIEKENIRVDKNGNLALTPHPKVFGDKLKHPYITTDFSESQVEMITPPLPDIKQMLGFLETIQNIVNIEIGDEFLWQQSTPPELPDEELIPVAQFNEDGKQAQYYREFLAKKYGKKNQMFSGIHFNFSLDESLIQTLHKQWNNTLSLAEFKNEVYMKTVRQLLRNRWLYILLFGNSPVVDKSFRLQCKQAPYSVDKNVLALSVRNSCYGYRNIGDFFPDYSSLQAYLNSIEQMVKDNKIASPKELYTAVRPKFLNGKDTISYIEIRFIDIDPLSKIGVSEEALQFIHLLVLYGLLSEEPDKFSAEDQLYYSNKHGYMALYGLQNEVYIHNGNEQKENAYVIAKSVLESMKEMIKNLEITDPAYIRALDYAYFLAENPSERKIFEVINGIVNNGYTNYYLGLSKKHKAVSMENLFNFKGLEDMELSTQLLLREAVRRGVSFEILDRKENFVRFKRFENVQFVKQATKTSLDNYASVLMMENKLITKIILDQNSINTPGGFSFDLKEKAQSMYHYFENKAIVVKPNQTNFGIGITIIKNNIDKQLFNRAVEIAFENDSTILIEEFVEGKEYRMFVIDNEVAGILHRVPANVVGDGQKSLKELVTVKNFNPLRGTGYRTPLEKIKMGEAESIFLKSQHKDFEYIPALNETVFLRENSNISTGGDSIDFTDEIHDSYKKIAIQASKALNVCITGLDMIIKDIEKEATTDNYSIIEMNFNPAIHIHSHPFKGKNRNLNEKLMDALGYKLEI